jgi:hypothetical protein
MLKKKIWAHFQRIVEVFAPKIFNMLSNIWVWDPGSEIQDPEKTYSGSRIQGSKRHRIPDPDPQHWLAEPIIVHSDMIPTFDMCSFFRFLLDYRCSKQEEKKKNRRSSMNN